MTETSTIQTTKAITSLMIRPTILEIVLSMTAGMDQESLEGLLFSLDKMNIPEADEFMDMVESLDAAIDHVESCIQDCQEGAYYRLRNEGLSRQKASEESGWGCPEYDPE